MSDYELAAEERAFMRAVVVGLAHLDAGREVSPSPRPRPDSAWHRDMTVARVSFAESALSDLAGASRAWYATEGVPEIGDRLVAEVFQRVDVLADHPDLGGLFRSWPTLSTRTDPPALPDRLSSDPLRIRIVRVWRSERLLRLPASARSQDPAG